MAYTRHGHHIPGTSHDEPPASLRARCGGPGLCPVCRQDSFLKKNPDAHVVHILEIENSNATVCGEEWSEPPTVPRLKMVLCADCRANLYRPGKVVRTVHLRFDGEAVCRGDSQDDELPAPSRNIFVQNVLCSVCVSTVKERW